MGVQPTRPLCPWDFPGKNTDGAAIASSKDLPYPGIEPTPPVSPALAGRVFTTELPREL